ncbi:unnamed protein product [Clonostachys rosea f. rosea IK726]|uniref:NACHT domain-containing protein n=2 Tax=Bionectria ochroleuca TaxID=29856 RepID=A0A0B7KK70_BIOOC|nr:unnamed protein product [Clonostachys rosea f. rosea IK726]
MRLLECSDGGVRLTKFQQGSIPEYAILSHTWGSDGDEVTYSDMVAGIAVQKLGYGKITFCRDQAKRDNLRYFWIDTCCINKDNGPELLASLNSMFAWYKDSKKCYVYLSDVSKSTEQPAIDSGTASWELAFRNSRWFTRGWTLQELIAPRSVTFYSKEGHFLGDKTTLESLIHDITRIPAMALRGSPLSQFTVEDRFAWMNNRTTKEPEDLAYALQGLFDIFLPMMYGCGKTQAVQTLRRSIHDDVTASLSVTDADTYLRNDHYNDERLKIERLSRTRLSMRHCYINLAIIKRGQGSMAEEPQSKSSPFELAHRLKIQDLDKDINLDLTTLFDTCQNSENRRILIRGRAGVGKTTLCKKIVFEFEQHGLWNNLFERVLWFPLRGLKTWTSNDCNLKEFLHHFYFPHHRFGVDLADRLACAIDFDGHRYENKTTLFILDGLDEVANTWNPGDAKYDFLTRLLDQPNVIITSRPHAQIPEHVARHIDLEVETIGFYADQVEQYLQMAFRDIEKAAKAQDVLRKFPLIESLVRIPILLDAFCFTWDTLNLTDNHATRQTMTSFYQAIVEELLRKDVVRSEKPNGQPVTETTAAGLLACQLEAQSEEQLRLLEDLAFTGMFHDMIEFEPYNRNIILEKYGHHRNITLTDQCLRSSFLRTSDVNETTGSVSYHFLHLTFQEFFAAKYFVRRWTSERGIICLDLGSRTTQAMQRDDFLARYKYEQRYDIFWRFVAGSIDALGQEEITRFFCVLEDPQSRDLLGPVHQRLIMHCLAEVSPQMSLRADLELKLENWLMFEIMLKGSSGFLRESEFPEGILCKLVDDAWGTTLCNVLEALSGRSTIGNTLLRPILARLNDLNKVVRRLAVSALRKRASDPQVQQALLNRLADDDGDVRAYTAIALRSRASNPQVQQALLNRLNDGHHLVRAYTAIALRSRASDPRVQQALLNRLGDHHHLVRAYAAKALRSRASDPRVQQALLNRLGDHHHLVRAYAAKALRSRASDPQLQQALLNLLSDHGDTARQFAADALDSQGSNPHIQQLNDHIADVRVSVIWALHGQAPDPQVQHALIKRLNSDVAAKVREAAADTLGGQGSGDQVQRALLTQLNDSNAAVRRAVIYTLKHHVSSTEVRQDLIHRLDDNNANVRWAAVNALSSRASDLQVQHALIDRLMNDTAGDVRMFAANALSNRASHLQVQRALIDRLKNDAAPAVKRAAAHALISEASSPYVQQALIGWFNDDVAVAAERIFLDALHLTGFGLFGNRHIKQLYAAALDRSFEEREHYCWQLRPNGLRVFTP